MLENVTIIIPAHNRPERLARLLEYYSTTAAQILIPDSSTLRYEGRVESENVIYRHYPGMHFFLKLREVMPLIDRDYVVWVADDDFTVPEGIQACTEFLDQNPGFSCAQGHYLTFTPGPGGKIRFTPRYIRNHDNRITASDPIERLRAQKGMYASMLYGVTRADIFRRIYSYVFNPDGSMRFTNLFLAEEFFNHAMLICGRYATLPVFFSARERIAGSATETTIPSSVIKNAPEYRPEYDGFIQALSLLLTDSTTLSADEAEAHMRSISQAPVDKPSVLLKRRINRVLASNSLLRWASRLSEWRYHTKGLRAVRNLPSYPCFTPTPARSRIESLIASTRSTK